MGGGRLPSDHIPSALDDGVSDASASSSDYPSEDSSLPDSAVTTDLHADTAPTWDCQQWHRAAYAKPMNADALRDAKNRILRHKPGDWIEEVGGTTARDYEVPETTTLLLVGPRGSGKSTLVNRITRVFDDDPSALDRAQVSYNLLATGGTLFLQEYMIPRTSKSLCIYDTRSISTNLSENYGMLGRWMTRGVRHGEMVVSDSDDFLTRISKYLTSQQGLFNPCAKRVVNFVIFVVDGVSVLNCMQSDDGYNEMIAKTFNYPFFQFKDNKPAVAITHGDELSLSQRAQVHAHLGELLGIPPIQQIFDIPGIDHNDTEYAIVDILRYSIEHADRNLPFRQNYLSQGQRSFHRLMKMLQQYDIVLETIIVCLCILVLWLRAM